MGKQKTLTDDDVQLLIAQYKGRTSLKKIAEAFRIGTARVQHVLASNGIALRRQSTEVTTEAEIQKLKELHAQGMSTLRLASALNTSRGVIGLRLKTLGLKPLTGTQANIARMQSMSLDERKALTRAANEAMRGSDVPRRRLILRALDIERACRQSEPERQVQAKFRKLGLNLRPQAAFDKYNIDLAHVEGMVAIEVNNSWHMETRKAVADAQKLHYLTKAGWMLVYVDLAMRDTKQYEAIAELCALRHKLLKTCIV